MFINLIKLVETRNQRRSHEDQPSGVRVIGYLSEDGGGGEEGGEESRKVGAGMDGHIDRVGGHEGCEGVVDGDGVDGVAAVEDVAEADVVCVT